MHSTGNTEEALLYLFIAAALGSFLGNIKIKGNGLGVAMVLFVGLALGAARHDLHIPDIIKMLGLAIFVYSIGLSSGPSFFSTLKSRGFANVLLAAGALTLLSVMIGVMASAFGFSASAAAGLLAGITTNTPALATLLDAIQARGGDQTAAMSDSAVVGYSISYPMGVIGLMVAMVIVRRLVKVDDAKEVAALRDEFPSGQPIINQTLEISHPELLGLALREIKNRHHLNIIFGRLRRKDEDSLCHLETVFEAGDRVAITGEAGEVERTAQLLGRISEDDLTDDRSVFEMRRIFVSNPKVAGRTVASLNLVERFPVVLTRIRRGDVDSLVQSATVLELGDRIRVLARPEDLKQISALMGDSYEELSHIDLLSFGLGMGLGIMLGSIEMTLPGGILFSLGFAGGPLVAGLVLSYLRRSGPILWTLPYSANLTLRQIGLMLMLAAIGINSGAAFLQTVMSPVGPLMFLSSIVVSIVGSMAILLIGYRLMHIPFGLLSGMVSHHPANLDFANNTAGNKLPTYGYALVYPLLLIGKIVFVQMLWQVLRSLGL